MDQGIIRSFKLHYHKRMLKALVACMDQTSTASELAKKISLADAVSWIRLAWDEVHETTIQKCFKKCGVNTGELQNLNSDFFDPVE